MSLTDFDNTSTIEGVGKCSLNFYFLEEFMKNWYLFFFEHLVEFTSVTTEVWKLLCGNFKNY